MNQDHRPGQGPGLATNYPYQGVLGEGKIEHVAIVVAAILVSFLLAIFDW